VTTFDDRVLKMDPIVARVAGASEDGAESKGRHPGLADIVIAATARAFSLTAITENPAFSAA
jgi:predicted nucleic acid-binding protein